MTYPRLFVLLLCASSVGGLISWQLTRQMPAPVAAATRLRRRRMPLRSAGRGGRADGPDGSRRGHCRGHALRGVAPSASVAMADVGFHVVQSLVRGAGGELAARELLLQRGAQSHSMADPDQPDAEGARRPACRFPGDLRRDRDERTFKEMKDTIDMKDTARFRSCIASRSKPVTRATSRWGRPTCARRSRPRRPSRSSI